MTHDVEYDRAEADAWTTAKNLFRIPSTIDEKAFRGFLLANATPDLGLKYAVIEKPTVTIAKDIGDALAKEA